MSHPTAECPKHTSPAPIISRCALFQQLIHCSSVSCVFLSVTCALLHSKWVWKEKVCLLGHSQFMHPCSISSLRHCLEASLSMGHVLLCAGRRYCKKRLSTCKTWASEKAPAMKCSSWCFGEHHNLLVTALLLSAWLDVALLFTKVSFPSKVFLFWIWFSRFNPS